MRIALSKIKPIALKIAKRGGELQLENYGKVRKVVQKGRHGINLVTDVDKKVEHYIVRKLSNAFPDHQILAEEGSLSKSSSPFKWLIDPLDGTTNYTHGFPFFSVSLGLEVHGKIVFGIVYAPMLRELFVAERGKGAFLNGKRIRASKEKVLIKSLLATGFPYDVGTARRNNIALFSTFLKKARAIRRAGAASIDLCYVACGRFDGFWELRLKPWDIAAGTLMIEEAGGKISGFLGEKLDLYESGDVVGSNGRVHAALLQTIRQLEKKT